MSNERIQKAAAELIAAMAERPSVRATSAAEYLSQNPGLDDAVYRATVDSNEPCPGCGGTDGAVIVVFPHGAEGIRPSVCGRVLVAGFNHDHRQISLAALDVEAAKQLVNRLGEAIAVAESLD